MVFNRLLDLLVWTIIVNLAKGERKDMICSVMTDAKGNQQLNIEEDGATSKQCHILTIADVILN